MTADDYRRLVGALAAAANRRDAELANAERSYQDGAAVAAAELALANAEAGEADRRAGAAATAVVKVDREATRLWDELRRVLGWRGRRLGDLPPPTPVDLLPTGSAPAMAVDLLDGAARRIDQARRGAPRPPLPRWILPLLPPLGALGATMTGLVAGGLVTIAHFDTGLQWPLRLLGWLAFLLAPFTSVPVAAICVDRQFNSRLDTGAAGLTVLGGLCAGCALSLLFAR
ncbi:hypothetical protein [Phytohabitans aurantiacus]|uniref:Uncharacterized protein n=1 Tax=Phytohabitans aurantiacus TaxID=3016789 RepID=A0ABQ5QN43_9ACTN|nr:hypothetical protein [Phytohabitans aurantiacus]GLH95659.1 hypothetical protein Pa4123_09310 [Phytohabitans aurantiacus]